MGEWTVLKRWLPGSFPADVTHELNDMCNEEGFRSGAARCYPVVAEHQDFPTGAPEFTISLKWQEGDLIQYMAGKQSQAHGWRYTARWVEDGKQRTISGYGYGSREAAKAAVEEKVTKIVKAQQAEEVYKFTPEV